MAAPGAPSRPIVARVDNGGGSSLRSASSRRSGFGTLYQAPRIYRITYIVHFVRFPPYGSSTIFFSTLEKFPPVWIESTFGVVCYSSFVLYVYIYIHIVILNFFLLSSLFLHPFFFNAVELFPRFPALHDLCDVPVGKDSFVEKNVTTRCTTSGNVMLIDFCCVKSEHEYGKCRGRKREGTNVDRSVSIAQVLSRVVNTCSDIGPISRTYLLIFRYA